MYYLEAAETCTLQASIHTTPLGSIRQLCMRKEDGRKALSRQPGFLGLEALADALILVGLLIFVGMLCT